jgi:hypothetical protein
VRLTDTERAHLTGFIAAGTAAARKLLQARILLKADAAPAGPAWGDQASADAVEVSQPHLPGLGRLSLRDGLRLEVGRERLQTAVGGQADGLGDLLLLTEAIQPRERKAAVGA